MVRIAVTKTAATWLGVKVETSRPIPVVAVTYSKCAERQRQAAPLERHPEDDDRHERSG